MFLSDFSIKKPTATIVLIVAMMAMGLMAMHKLRVNQNPDVEVPGMQINIPYPGASPDTVEREIVNRLEKTLQTISGANHVYADAREGNASFWIEFSFKKNMIGSRISLGNL